MKLEDIELKVRGVDECQLKNYRWILFALLKSGGLDGVKRGRTILHFNSEGGFEGIQFDYWPWKERNKNVE